MFPRFLCGVGIGNCFGTFSHYTSNRHMSCSSESQGGFRPLVNSCCSALSDVMTCGTFEEIGQLSVPNGSGVLLVKNPGQCRFTAPAPAGAVQKPTALPCGAHVSEGFHTTLCWTSLPTNRGLDGRQKGRSRVRRKRAPRLPFQRPVGPNLIGVSIWRSLRWNSPTVRFDG